MNLWPFKKRRPKIIVIRRDRCELTLDAWQSNADFVKHGQNLLANDYMKLALDMLRNSHPAWVVMHPSTELSARAAHQARCEGYTLALANLEAIGKSTTTVEPLESKYEEEEEVNINPDE